MSVIRKKPFIESVIESLTDEQKASLLSVMNGSEATVNASFTNLPEADVASVLFQLEPNNLKTGILIQGSTYDVLLAYHRFQDMQIYNLDLSKFTFEKINEYLDINELRRTVSGGSGGGSGTNLDINLTDYCSDEDLLALVTCLTGDAPSYPAGQTISFSEAIDIDYDEVDKVTLYFEIQTGESETLNAKAVLYKSSSVGVSGSGLTVEVHGYFGSIAFRDTKNIVSHLQLGTSFVSNNKFDHLEYVSTVPEEVVPVEANPTLAGTESPLTGLQVGDTKYAVGGGSGAHAYRLSFSVEQSSISISLLYLTDNGNITDSASLYSDLNAKGFTSNANLYPINQMFVRTYPNANNNYTSIYCVHGLRTDVGVPRIYFTQYAIEKATSGDTEYYKYTAYGSGTTNLSSLVITKIF